MANEKEKLRPVAVLRRFFEAPVGDYPVRRIEMAELKDMKVEDRAWLVDEAARQLGVEVDRT